MKIYLATIDWQAIASILTFCALLVAFIAIYRERKEKKQLAGHLVSRFILHLESLLDHINGQLKKTPVQDDHHILDLIPEIIDNVEMLRTIFSETHWARKALQRAVMYKVIAETTSIREHKLTVAAVKSLSKHLDRDLALLESTTNKRSGLSAVSRKTFDKHYEDLHRNSK